MLPGFSCRDLEAVLVKYSEDEAEKSVVMCPAFWFQGSSVMAEFEELVQHCEEKDLHLVIGCDSSPQNMVRASTDCNNR
jgi:predicted alpha/beta superfamily hydrolase